MVTLGTYFFSVSLLHYLDWLITLQISVFKTLTINYEWS